MRIIDKIEVSVADGTLVRHKIKGYEGKIDGITEIKACFTQGGVLLTPPLTQEPFQYRVVVTGEAIRHIAPPEDLEILEASADVLCFRCHMPFRTKPGLFDKPAGRCECGGLICPTCWRCQATEADSIKESCSKQRKRLVRKLANEKKNKSANQTH